jgi:chaperone modulatory protein CbpM
MERDDLIPIEDLCRHYSVELTFVTDLNDYALLDFVRMEQALYLRKAQLNEFEMLCRMHYELDINMQGMDAIAHLLQKVKAMQEELNDLRLRADLDLSDDYHESIE